MIFGDNKYIIYKLKTRIDSKNIKELEFLELLSIIDKYSELNKEEMKIN